MALLFNPVRRDELFDSNTGKIKDTLIPDIAAVGTATDISFDPTGLTNITETNLQLVLKEIDPLLGGGGGGTAVSTTFDATGLNNVTATNVQELGTQLDALVGKTKLNTNKHRVVGLGANLANYAGQFIGGMGVVGSGKHKVKIKLVFLTTGSVTVDLKLIDSTTATHTYHGKANGYDSFESLNADASVNLTTGTTEYTFLDNVIIDLDSGANQLMFKASNTNLVDDMYVEISTEPVIETEYGTTTIIPEGL